MPKIGQAPVTSGRPSGAKLVKLAKVADESVDSDDATQAIPLIVPANSDIADTASETTTTAGLKRRRRRAGGSLRAIMSHQKATKKYIPHTRMYRLCKDLITDLKPVTGFHPTSTVLISKGAIAQLHEISEAHLIELMSQSMKITAGARCKTLMPWHVAIVRDFMRSTRAKYNV